MSAASVLLALGVVSLLAVLVTYGAAARVLRRRACARDRPPISILKPLKGLDPHLYENLAALATQVYPSFEIILGAADPDDPAIAVALQLQRDFSEVAITVVRGAPALGGNGKVQNLAALARRARHEHLLISDSDVRPAPEYLEALAAELGDPEVHLVSSVLVGRGSDTLGALFETLHLNAFVLSCVSAASVLVKHPCVVGKSMLFRRCDLAQVGGFAGVKDVLAEDYVLGQRFHGAGLKVALSSHPVPVIHHGRTLRDFCERQLRWHQIRRRLAPGAYAAELLLNPTASLMAAAGAALLEAEGALTLMAVAALAVRCAADGLLGAGLGHAQPWSAYAWVPAKDLVIAGIWVVGWFRRTVNWRGSRLRIARGSAVEPLTPLARPAAALGREVA